MNVATLILRSALAALLSVLLVPAAVAQVDVSIETYTEGQDADSAPGPVLIVGSTVNWTYEVSNTSSRPIVNIVVTDDQGVTVSCPDTTLDAGTSFTCTASGTVVAGQYANTGTVNAELQDATPISASDPSHYFGQASVEVTLEVATNGLDADTATGPVLAVGDAVSWTYEVTNVGSDTLINIAVSDDHGVSVSCPATTLIAGAAMTCTASGTAQVGQYENIGSVMAELQSTSDIVAATDPSHYFGQTVQIETATNGDDADAAPGPALLSGDTVTWTYVVSNPGPAALSSVSVTDDQGVTVTCPQSTLSAGDSMTCTASGSAAPGQYSNTGTVTGQLPLGGTVSASDPSHYFVNVIAIEKATNGVDADTAPGVVLTPGDAVNWTYVVTNLDTDVLSAIAVTDDQGVTVTCPGTSLNVGESMTCTASGTAIVGQYQNIGLVEATSTTLGAVSAYDQSHYFGQNQQLDFGDAPEPPYQVSLAQDGARHLLGSGVFLGDCVDAELDALPDAAAGGDDADTGATVYGTCASAGDDDDGVSFTSALTIGLSATVDVVASSACTLSAWIDYDGDGLWGDAEDELFPGGTVLAAGSNALSFTVPATATAGTTFARFRCTTDGAVGFTGEASDGEVEDYPVTIVAPTPTMSASKSDSLLVDADSDGNVDPGDTIRYTVVIDNAGTGAGSSVQFSDTPDGNSALVVGSVTTTQGSITVGNSGGDSTVSVSVGSVAAAGGSVTITFDVTVDDPLPLGVSSVSNQGSVSGGNFTALVTDDPDSAGADEATVTALQVPPAISASKSDALLVDVDSDGNVDPGDTVRYTVTVGNAGTGAAGTVQFADTPDGNSALIAGSVATTQGTVTTGNSGGDSSVLVDIGTLAGLGGSATITFDVLVDDPLALGITQLSNQGSVSGDNFVTVATDDPAVGGSADPTVTPLQAPPQITASKVDTLQVDVDSDGEVDPGDTLRYTITVANAGTGDATAVLLSDTPDGNSALVAGSVTTSQGSVTSGNAGGDTAVAIDLGTLAGLGGSATITFDVVVDDPLALGVVSLSNQASISGSNFATVASDDPDAAGSSNPTVTALQAPPAVTASKTDALQVDVDSDGLPDPGDTLRYTIVVDNSGTGDAVNLTLADTLDGNTTLVVGSVTTTQGTVASGNGAGDSSVAVDLGTLTGLGGSATVTFDAMIVDPVPTGVGSVSNQAMVSGDNVVAVASDDPAQPGSSDPTVTALQVPPIVSASKSAQLVTDIDGNSLVDPGDTLRYTVVLDNAAASPATGVVFDDLPDANTQLVSGSVTTTQGSVTLGNAGGATVQVDVGSVAGGSPVTIMFDVVVLEPADASVSSVSNQGIVSGDNFTTVPTDDPAVGGSADPTVTAIRGLPLMSASNSVQIITDVAPVGGSPGDTLRYTVVIRNDGSGPALDVVFDDQPSVYSPLVAGSVVNSAGTVNSGNTAGDTTVSVAIGTIAPGEAVTIMFEVRIASSVPSSIRTLSNSGRVSGSNFASFTTDDPTMPGAADATVLALSGTAFTIPAVGSWSLLLLMLVTCLVAGRRLLPRQD